MKNATFKYIYHYTVVTFKTIFNHNSSKQVMYKPLFEIIIGLIILVK